MERALEKAAEDDDIAMVFFRPDMISAGMAGREELRQSLARFAAKGKPVVCSRRFPEPGPTLSTWTVGLCLTTF